MPRTREAVAALKGFLRGELKGDPNSGDVIFAKGIKAALEWLTDENRPCPYAELEADLGEGGGWEDQPAEITYVGQAKHSPLQPAEPQRSIIIPGEMAQPTKSREELLKFAASKGLELTEDDLTAEFAAAVPSTAWGEGSVGSNPKMVMPGAVSVAATGRPWVQQLLKDTANDISAYAESGRVVVDDSNTVIVGAGLEDEPVLGGNWN